MSFGAALPGRGSEPPGTSPSPVRVDGSSSSRPSQAPSPSSRRISVKARAICSATSTTPPGGLSLWRSNWAVKRPRRGEPLRRRGHANDSLVGVYGAASGGDRRLPRGHRSLASRDQRPLRARYRMRRDACTTHRPWPATATACARRFSSVSDGASTGSGGTSWYRYRPEQEERLKGGDRSSDL